LRRSGDELDDLLGDSITEGLPRIVAGMFDGDTEALLNMIADYSVDEYVRDALFGAATFLAWEGRIERDRLADFLEHFRRQRLAPDRDFGWVGWQRAVALLGLNHLAPQVHEAFRHGRICKTIMSRSDFDGDLDAPWGDPASVSRFKRPTWAISTTCWSSLSFSTGRSRIMTRPIGRGRPGLTP